MRSVWLLSELSGSAALSASPCAARAFYRGPSERPDPSTLILCSFANKSVVWSTFCAECLQELPKKEARRLVRTRAHQAKIIFLKVPFYVHFCSPQTPVEQFCTVIYLPTKIPQQIQQIQPSVYSRAKMDTLLDLPPVWRGTKASRPQRQEPAH